MKKILALLFCCYVATIASAQNNVNVTFQNTGGNAWGVLATWSSSTTPNYGNTFASGGTISAGATGSGTASGWGNWGGGAQSPYVSLLYYTNSGHVGLGPPFEQRVNLNATYAQGAPASLTLTFTPPGGSNPATNMCNFTFAGKNNDVTWHVFQLYLDGDPYNPVGFTANVVGPGRTFKIEFSDWCTNAGHFEVNYSMHDLEVRGYDLIDSITNAVITTNSSGYPANTNYTLATPVGGLYFDPSKPNGSNIIWSAGSLTNNTTATREGSQAIKSSIDSGTKATIDALTNLLGRLGATNGTGDSDAGMTNAIDRFRQQNTNLLSQILTNLQRGTNISTGALLTNAESLTEAALGQLVDINGNIDSALTAMGSVEAAGFGADGTAEVFAFSFAGHEINLDPEIQYPGVMGIAKILLTGVVLLLYGLSVSKMFWEVIKVYASAQTGGVPNIQTEFAGFGGNVAGTLAAPGMMLAFIAVWVVVLTSVSAAWFGALGDFSFSASMTAMTSVSLPPGARYLLYKSTPVQLILSLFFSRIVLWLTASKAVMLAATASRFIAGK